MISRLSYIQDLGFDAVWISPITLQGADSMGAAGYHGYWPADLYKLNPAFGSQEDLQALIAAYHQRGEGRQFLQPFSASRSHVPALLLTAWNVQQSFAVTSACGLRTL